MTWQTLLLVACGGAAGAVARVVLGAGVQGLCAGLLPGRWPMGTLVVNLTGAFAIGVAAVLYADREPQRALVVLGVLGGYTTFSAFAWETLALWHDGEVGRALLYVALSNLGSLLCVWLGWRVAQGLT